jgi:tetratricopeptide (TPR) repeat protein
MPKPRLSLLLLSLLVSIAGCQNPSQLDSTSADGAAVVNVLPSPTQGQGVIEARAILDGWEGDAAPLAQAKALLERELAANPKNYEALIELARYAVMTGDLGGNNGAIQMLERAEAIDPTNPAAFVLKGHVLTNMQFYEAAARALDEAERLKSDSPWLLLNRADLLKVEGKDREAADLCGAVIERGTENIKALITAYHCRASYRRMVRDWDGADSDYRAVLEREPDDAIALAHYIYFLCFHRDRCSEAAELQVRLRSVSRIRDVDTADTLLRYDNWGRLAAKHGVDSPEAVKALEAAQQLLPDLDLVMPRYAGKQGNQPLLKALLAKGVGVESLDVDGTTALMDAARAGHVESMKVLLANGADVNQQVGGRSALVFAAMFGHLDAAQLLVERGADSRSLPQEAIQVAKRVENVEVAEYLEGKFPAP